MSKVTARGRHGRLGQGRSPGKTYFDDLAQAYLLERKISGASLSWLNAMESFFNNKVLPSLCFAPVDDLTDTDIFLFISKHYTQRSLATRQRYLTYLKAAFNFGLKRQMISRNPLALWTRKKEPRKEMRLTLEDLERLISFCPDHLRWALYVQWEVATRPGPSELFALKWADVDFKRGVVHIPGTKTEHSDRVIPLSKEFLRELKIRKETALSAYIIEYKGKPVRSVKTALNTALERAKLPYKMRLYDIRHLVASILLSGGGDMASVSKLLGHSNISTTHKWYYHVLPGQMQRTIALRPRLSPSTGEGD